MCWGGEPGSLDSHHSCCPHAPATLSRKDGIKDLPLEVLRHERLLGLYTPQAQLEAALGSW